MRGRRGRNSSSARCLVPERPLNSAEARPISKRSVVALSEAMKRSFASAIATDLISRGTDDSPSFVIAIFQHRAYFDLEAARYGAFAAAGAKVIVGYPGCPRQLPKGMVGVDIANRDELHDSWVLVVLNRSLAAALVAVDDHGMVDGATIESSRSFVARWTFRRQEATEAFRQIVRPLSALLPTRILAQAEATIRSIEQERRSPTEDHLATAIEVISSAFELRARQRGSYATDWDLLTNVYNRQFFDRFVASRAECSAALVTATMLDINGLARFNEEFGEEAGDLVLISVADMLRKEQGSSELVVRFGDDEFLLLSPVIDREGALGRAERLILAARALRLPVPCQNESVSLAASVAIADPTRIPFDRLVAALELSKASGTATAELVS